MAESAGPFAILDPAGAHIGAVDDIFGSPMPVLRVTGWIAVSTTPTVRLQTRAGIELTPLSVARTARPDVVDAGATSNLHSGFRADFHLSGDDVPLSIRIDDNEPIPVSDGDAYGTVRPHYEGIFTDTRVLRRDDIYGYGPPTDSAQMVKDLLGQVAGKVLDFGCGNGDILSRLVEQGCEATGLELDAPRIHAGLKPAIRDHVQLYGGGVPLPFDDAAFDWIVSSEVVEHIDDIEQYIPEFSRVLRPGGLMFLTTPDITSIPSSFPTGTVPWHLLESTHVRFFTPSSLRALLAPYFSERTLYAIGDSTINGWLVPGSIAAVFEKKT